MVENTQIYDDSLNDSTVATIFLRMDAKYYSY